MLFVDFEIIPPFEDKYIITLSSVEDFSDFDIEHINQYDYVIDIRGCKSNNIVHRIKSILDTYPSIPIFVNEPVDNMLLSRTDSVIISDFNLTKKAGIIELLIKFNRGESPKFMSKVRKIYNLGE